MNSSRGWSWNTVYSGLAEPAVDERTSSTLSLKNLQRALAVSSGWTGEPRFLPSQMQRIPQLPSVTGAVRNEHLPILVLHLLVDQLGRSKLIDPRGSILSQPGTAIHSLEATQPSLLGTTDGVEPGSDRSVVPGANRSTNYISMDEYETKDGLGIWSIKVWMIGCLLADGWWWRGRGAEAGVEIHGNSVWGSWGINLLTLKSLFLPRYDGGNGHSIVQYIVNQIGF